MSNKLFYLVVVMAVSVKTLALPLHGADALWDNDIKSIALRHVDNAAAQPIITLGSSEQVRITFDDLGGNNRRFIYKIILCDADWQKSDLPFAEYISGFQEDNVENYRQSFNTLTPYTFYELRIPNDNTQILLSGNYLIQIMDSSAPDSVLFQKGFMVMENSLPFMVICNINLIPLAGQRNCSQQLDIKVDYQDLNVQNPRKDIKVRIMQNGYYPPEPPPQAIFFASTAVDYSFHDKNLYSGGAEFRQFDISSFEYLSLRVQAIEVANGRYLVRLPADAIVPQHFTYIDNNGRYLIHSARYPENSDTESDYALVFFTLFTQRPLDGSIYIFGELTNWEISPRCHMQYNAACGCYETALPLKQGIYDYRYVLVNKGIPDMSAIEYCSAETENSYGVLVYYRAMNDRNDRLVNVSWFSTKK